jgi:general secretion pathway protein A
MYERFYNLRERPFALSPDPEYLFLSQVHSEALDSIRYGIESRAGFIVVTGEIGAGKTTLLQSILQRLDDRTVIARVVNTMLEPRELLDAIALDFGLDNISPSKPVLLRDLGLFLVEQRQRGRRPLLVIDEAQNLSPQALEEVRLLSNLETEKSKLLQILLAGQPNLRDKIASPELEQFRQRIAVSYHLRPISAPETEAYINFRLEHAALGQPLRFPSDACSLIHQVTGGVPRLINVLCDAALVFGYAEERRAIDCAMIDEVITELEETGIVRRPVAVESASAAAPEAARESLPQPTVAPALTPTPAVAQVSSPALPTPASSQPPVVPVPAIAASTVVRPEASSGTETPMAPKIDATAPASTPSLWPRGPMVDTSWRPAATAATPAATSPLSAARVQDTPPQVDARPAAVPPSFVTNRPSASVAPLPHAPVAAVAETRTERDRSLSAARDAALQATQLASTREELVAEREGISRRQRDLVAKEEALRERERQIAEQRRIMGEEYRLLRQTRPATATASATAAPSASIGNRPGMRHGMSGAPGLTFWQRLFRLFTWSHAVRS